MLIIYFLFQLVVFGMSRPFPENSLLATNGPNGWFFVYMPIQWYFVAAAFRIRTYRDFMLLILLDGTIVIIVVVTAFA